LLPHRRARFATRGRGRIPSGAKRLRDGTVAEIIIGTVVVALVSVIGLLSPA